MTQNIDQLAKVLILGDSKVGKTNMIYRYTEDFFEELHIETIGIYQIN